MFGNRNVTTLSLTGVVIMSLGTVLGLIAVATTDWMEAPLAAVVGFDAPGMPSAAMCRVGLWETCCSDSTPSTDCIPAARHVTSSVQALRILMAISVCWMAVSVIVILVYIFKDFRNRAEGVKQCISFIFSTGTVMFLMVVMSYAMTEYKADPGLFAAGEVTFSTSFRWSFFVALIGALLAPIGVFLICTQWHMTEDKEAGVDHDYDGKFTEDTYI